MNFPKITSTLSGIVRNNLDAILFAILVIALGFYVSHLSEKVDEAKTYKAMQQKLIHDYEVEQKYLEDNKASILKEMDEAQKKQDALYQEYLKNKKANEDKLQNADSRLQDLDGCIRLVSFECTNTQKNASGGAVSTAPPRPSLITTAYAHDDILNKPSVQSGSNHIYSPTTQSSVGKDSGNITGSDRKLQVAKQTGKAPSSPRKDAGENIHGNESSARVLALEMIRKYEGLRLTAYWDHLGYSIGYGTRSYAGEKITKQEAERRLQEIVDKLIARIRKNYPKSSDNKIAALTSLRYNCERCYLRVTAKVKKGQPKIEYWKNGAGGRQLKGLLKRREEEVRLFLIEK
ncbi:MAG: lysozyme [Candidatus Gracilibacteria bacterium]